MWRIRPCQLRWLNSSPWAAPGALAIAGDLIYVAEGIRATDGRSSVEIIDISIPATPVKKGEFQVMENAMDVAVSGNLALVSGSIAGLEVYDVADLAHPAFITRRDTPGIASGMVLSGNLALVADQQGLQIISVAIPTEADRRGGLPAAALSARRGGGGRSGLCRQRPGADAHRHQESGIPQNSQHLHPAGPRRAMWRSRAAWRM